MSLELAMRATESPIDALEKISCVEAALLDLPQAPIRTVHTFAPGLYVRTIHIPAGTLLTGIVHRHDDIACVLQGDISIYSEGGWRRVQAPYVGIAKAGAKRLGYAHTDVVYSTTHATNETDIEKLEELLFFSDTGVETAECRRVRADREDFALALAEAGLTPATVRAISENESDQIAMLDLSTYIAPSCIEGLGVMAAADFPAGAVVTKARIGNLRTSAGRYMNHSATPNVVGRANGTTIEVVALRDIVAGEELTNDYRLAMKLGGLV